ncbi:MAG TPA: DNA mismatch repair protein MutS, partial [Candidatus Krumholzibacteria bacterium]|nr:DNA mismatch repair protein MutS [Candidatus Krumholzibacteria bacterium]
ECACGEGAGDAYLHLIQGKKIRELVVPASSAAETGRMLAPHLGTPFLTALADEEFSPRAARAALAEQFGAEAEALAGALTAGETAVTGALIRHCLRLRGGALPQVVGVARLGAAPFLSLDEETIANLELFEPLRGGLENATLLRTLDRTLTPMGARALRHWIQRPLCDVALIDERLDAVALVHGDATRAEALVRGLKGIADVQRLAARIASRKAIPRELHALRESLEKIPALRGAVEGCGAALLERSGAMLGDHAALCGEIARTIVAEPPSHLRDGGVIRRGCDPGLDTLIDESEAAKRWIAGLESRERERTKIASLKVGYNKVFGYYLEVSNANAKALPPDYVAKQSLVNGQRFFTPELKEKEDLILHTEEKRVREEQRVFDTLCATIASRAAALQRTAEAMAAVDAVQSLAMAARANGYRRPLVDATLELEIVGGRHPVLEWVVSEAFVPNDLDLDVQRRQFALITGPNMSGKSTFLRQTALIVLMAQMGSFVPADRARIGLVDRVFTRVGASDRLSRGESTFLVEMNETAAILRHMTNHSLVILDEIGRGTSTYDGLSIAWAVTEHLLQGAVARPRTLFATHFHELTQLRSSYPRLVNLKIAIREWEGGIVFLRKIVPGTSDRSFGIHAARVAGLPPSVIRRAEEILESLELRRNLVAKGFDLGGSRDQMSLFAPPAAQEEAPDDDLRRRIEAFDVDGSTPLAALQFIRDLKDRPR